MPANGRWPYHDPRWPKASRAAKARDGYACVVCGRTTADINPRTGRRLILDVDHIIEWTKRPDLAFVLENLRTLCRLHHNRRTHSRRPRRQHTRIW